MRPRNTSVLVVGDGDRVEPVVTRLRSKFDLAVLDERERLDETLARCEVVVWTDSLPQLAFGDHARWPHLDSTDGLLVAVADAVPDGSTIRCTRIEFADGFSSADELYDRIERLRRRARYDELLAEFAALAAERGSRETERATPPAPVDASDDDLDDRIDDLRSELAALLDEFDSRDYEAAFAAPDFAGRSRLSEAIVLS